MRVKGWVGGTVVGGIAKYDIILLQNLKPVLDSFETFHMTVLLNLFHFDECQGMGLKNFKKNVLKI